jgi:hypothetical protein
LIDGEPREWTELLPDAPRMYYNDICLYHLNNPGEGRGCEGGCAALTPHLPLLIEKIHLLRVVGFIPDVALEPSSSNEVQVRLPNSG